MNCVDITLMDDASGRKVGESLGLTTKGTLYVLLKTYRKKLISKGEAEKCLSELLAAGFRLSPELYSKALRRLHG